MTVTEADTNVPEHVSGTGPQPDCPGAGGVQIGDETQTGGPTRRLSKVKAAAVATPAARPTRTLRPGRTRCLTRRSDVRFRDG